MIAVIDRHALHLIVGIVSLLSVATLITLVLQRIVKGDAGRKTVSNLAARTKAWWVMAAVFGGALAFGVTGACVLFGFISFMALREMITLAPTRRADHHTLFWAFFVVIPLQYYLIAIEWYGFFSIFIPVYVFLFVCVRSTLTGDYSNYMERIAKIQVGVMFSVYFLSHAPALLILNVRGQRETWKLLVFLVVVVQMSDVLQYVWGKLLGRHKVAPHISPNKTWEGLIGGLASATLLGTAMHALTPFTWEMAAGISAIIALMGFFGGIVMSAIKRDAGIKDFGHLIEGHGGLLDRVDSLCFAAPVFFHLVRYWYV